MLISRYKVPAVIKYTILIFIYILNDSRERTGLTLLKCCNEKKNYALNIFVVVKQPLALTIFIITMSFCNFIIKNKKQIT